MKEALLKGALPLFPFDLERALSGDKMWVDGITLCYASPVENSIVWHNFYDETGGQWRIHKDGWHGLHMEQCYMLTPPPEIVNVEAMVKFERGNLFSTHSVDGCLWHSNRLGALLRRSGERFCVVTEITDWGFKYQTKVFDSVAEGWMLFNDIKFI